MIEQLRDDIPFGGGSLWQELPKQPGAVDEFFAMDLHDQARVAGWVNGCPVVEELTDPANTAPGRGPENMVDRYGEVNFWFGQICREVDAVNPELADWLGSPTLRDEREPVGKHEPESVPDSHYQLMSPLGALAGYALPRMFVEELRPAGADPVEFNTRMRTGLGVVRGAAGKVKRPLDFMALVAEGLAEADADPMKILKHAVSQGWFGEHNSYKMLEMGKKSLEKYAPNLWETYTSLTLDQKAAHGLA